MDNYNEFIYKRTYSRFDDNKKSREEWTETLDRWYKHMPIHAGLSKEVNALLQKTRKEMENMDVLPAMRTLWTAGKALYQNHIGAFNCSYLSISDIESFSEILYILMHGTGSGLSVEKKYVDKLPVVKEKDKYLPRYKFVIEDSKEGWQDAVLSQTKALYNGERLEFSYYKIRPAGSPLKTFGGRASGHEPLKELLDFMEKIFDGAINRKLYTWEVADIACMIAKVVIVGGTRRSSLMILTDIDDRDMAEYKNGDFYLTHEYRTSANISAVINDNKQYDEHFDELFEELKNSNSGERGIINRGVLSERASMLGRMNILDSGTNPCQPKEAKVLTRNGIVEFGDINVGDEIFSEDGWVKVTNKWSTGVKSVYKYKTTAGYFLGTENHRIVQNGNKIEVKDAESIDILRGGVEVDDVVINPQDVVDGLMIGDGSIMSWSNKHVHLNIGDNDQCYFDSEIKDYIGKCSDNNNGKVYYVKTTITQDELPKTYERRVPKRFMQDKNKLVGFLRGLYSANGSVVANGHRVTLKASSFGIIEDVQLMLSAIGIKSYYTTNKSKVVKFNNGEYQCKESYDLNVSTDRDKFDREIGFLHQYKNDKINLSSIGVERKKSYDIISIDYIGDMEVFDITVDGKGHTYWTGGCNVSNCGEVFLLDKEFCNLSEVVLRKSDNFDTLLSKIRTSVLFAVVQSQLTDFKNLSPKWKENCEMEKLIAVSLTGIYDWLSSDIFLNKDSVSSDPIEKKINLEKVKIFLDALKRYGKKVYNSILNTFPELAGEIRHGCIFTIKPSGTASQLAGCSSGIKPEQSEYYIRRVRVGAKDPLALLLIESGVDFDYENGQDENNFKTYVFSFYRKSYSDERLTLPNLSVEDQLKIWKIFNDSWIDHNPSATIAVGEGEWDVIKEFLVDNKDSVGGISFYPRYDGYHKLMPYEEISKEEYEKLIKNQVNIDFSRLSEYENEDRTEGSKSYACHAGRCEI